MALLTAKTKYGLIEGLPAANQMFSVFRGVPFAKAPVGELRWKDPQPLDAWDGVYPAYKFGNLAMQEPYVSEGGGIVSTEFYVGDYKRSEDCLYLNIWTPAKSADEKLPVAVYIHGGGHQTGYSYLNCYDGEGFCKRGVIMVSIAYRLNVFGYLITPELEQESETPGNFGVKDQLAALMWIRENIGAFGGDPDNITLFGQSGGASSVDNMVPLPRARGLIKRAIMQSGGGIRPVYSYWSESVEHAKEAGTAFLKELGVQNIREAREKSADEVLAAYTRFKNVRLNDKETSGMGGGFMRFSPVDDGKLYPKPVVDLYREGSYPELDFMLTSTAGEGHNTTIQNLAFAELNAKLGRKAPYLAYFTYVPPGAENAHHSVEHHYVFQTLMRSYRPYTGFDFELSNELADYWANFMKCGDPNRPGEDTWKPYEGGAYNVLEIGLERKMISLKDREDLVEKAKKLETGEQ